MTEFIQARTHHIATLATTVEEYVEPASGARHIHLASDQPELVFMVAFPTVPDSSDGRAHILEHLALCGSERYPVRDPFFAMMRRSTATFMNAFTYADRTVYPFASTDRADFFNLLDVYLDATFFPRLDYLNFLQEGWRYTVDNGKLGYQGVVLNEMKGAFGDPHHALHRAIAAAQLSNTTYENEYGGDPLTIPRLTHAMLLEFHASHYHPSQAIFMSAGAVPAAEVQRRIGARVLAKLPGRATAIMPQLAVAAAAPRGNTVQVPARAANADAHGVQLSWLLGGSADTAASHQARLLEAGLLGGSAAPVQKAMESAGYGRPSPLNGVDPGARQMLFNLGMEGLTLGQVDSARSHIWEALERTAVDGVAEERLQALLRSLKYQQRDTSRGNMPNIMARMLQALPAAMYGGDIVQALDSGAALHQMERDIRDPAFFKGLVRALLLSPTLLTTKVMPDADYFSKRDALEAAAPAVAQATLGGGALQRIEADLAALARHQDRSSDFSVLPRITPRELGRLPMALPRIDLAADGTHLFAIASNGISHALVEFDVSALPPEAWPWMTLYAELRGDLGVGERDYEQAAAWRERKVANLRAYAAAVPGGAGALQVKMRFAADALSEEQSGIAEVLDRFIGQPRFDEAERMVFLIERMYQDRLGNLAQDGDRYAALRARAPLSPLDDFHDRASGAAYLPFLAEIKRLTATAGGVQAIAGELASLHARIVSSTPSTLCAAGDDDSRRLAALLTGSARQAAPNPIRSAARAPATDGIAALASEALHAAGQVNHCNIAWKVPALGADEAPALAVAAELVTNQLLHSLLREKGGAYGGFARYDSDAGVFSMASYRDPRLAATYADFTTAIAQLLDRDFSVEQLEEAIVGVVKTLDKPKSPFDAVVEAWRLRLRGIDQPLRQRYRDGVLDCQLADVKTAVKRYLRPESASRAAFAGSLDQDLAGLRVTDLYSLARTT